MPLKWSAAAYYASLLRRCGNARDLSGGKRLHARLIESGLEADRFLGNLLVEMYSKCGAVEDARAVFGKICQRNVFSWTIMIGAYAGQGCGKEALSLFQQMQMEGVVPDKVTFISVLSACAEPAALGEGRRMHARIVNSGLLESDVVVENALVNMYGKCGSLEDARRTFDAMRQRNLGSWNAIITVYAQHGQGTKALQLFRQMQLEDFVPDKFTFVSILSACASQAILAEGKRMHTRLLASGFGWDIVLGNALVNMYSKCGSLEDARKMFNTMPERDVVSWNSIMTAYAQHGHGGEVLRLFLQMQREGVIPDKLTFVSALSACASQAALAEGKRMHSHIVNSRLESDVVLRNALVNMYGKCGRLEDAWGTFHTMPGRDVVSWNAMLAAYAQHGKGREAIRLFQQMRQEGVTPNEVTFVSILSACSHSGLVEEGYHFFVSMIQDHGIAPIVEHYHCMIDLLGRSGRLDEGESLITKMPYEPTAVTWMTLLGACRMHSDVERGTRAAEQLFGLDPDNESPYVLLSNMHAATGNWNDTLKVRKLMEDKGLKKLPGCSSIEVKNRVHKFFMGDQLHPQKDKIYAELQRLSRQMEVAGYVPDTKVVLYDTEEEEKQHILCYHSEKMAIAFGLISTPTGTPLLITKNLRVCQDCHSATKFISKVPGLHVISVGVRGGIHRSAISTLETIGVPKHHIHACLSRIHQISIQYMGHLNATKRQLEASNFRPP